MKRVLKVFLILIAGIVGVIILGIAVLLVSFVIARQPDRDSDKRAPDVRMEEYYGRHFTLISTQKNESSDITLWTLQDDDGSEYHAAQGQDYDGGTMVYRTYDDFRTVQRRETPAMQRLLAQEDFEVFYQSDLGQSTAFNHEYPYCQWVVKVEKYDDIASALQLVLDTVNAADSRLPETTFWKDDRWGSIEPEIRLGTQWLGTYAFGGEYDYETELYSAQENFCDWCRKNQHEELLPENVAEDHPQSGTYTLTYSAETITLPLAWDAEQRCFILREPHAADGDDNYPNMTHLRALLDLCGFDIRTSNSEFYYGYETRCNGDVVYMLRSTSTHDCSVDGGRGGFRSDGAYLELSEKQLADIFDITFAIDPQTMTGEIHFEGNTKW